MRQNGSWRYLNVVGAVKSARARDLFVDMVVRSEVFTR
jgi:hypothetical protein